MEVSVVPANPQDLPLRGGCILESNECTDYRMLSKLHADRGFTDFIDCV